jgi:hypothetical protein
VTADVEQILCPIAYPVTRQYRDTAMVALPVPIAMVVPLLRDSVAASPFVLLLGASLS